MAKTSIIICPSKDNFTMCRAWHVILCNGNHCAAEILNFIEMNTNSFIETAEKTDTINKSRKTGEKRRVTMSEKGVPVIPFSYEEFQEALNFQYGKNTIIDAVKYLVDEDLLKPTTNENSMDRVNYYQLNADLLNHFASIMETIQRERPLLLKAIVTKNNSKKPIKEGNEKVYFQTVHSLILNNGEFINKLCKVYNQTMQDLLLNDVYNVLRYILDIIKKHLEYKQTLPENPEPLEPEKQIVTPLASPPKYDNEKIDVIIKKFTNPDKAYEAWCDWKEYKRAEHKFQFKSIKTEAVSLQGLYEESGGDSNIAEKIVIKSIRGNWKGLFALSKEDQKPEKVNISDRSRYLRADAAEF